MIGKAGKITKAKNIEQAALALRKIIKGNKRAKKIDLGKITQHFENHFASPKTEDTAKKPTKFFRLVIKLDDREAFKFLSKNKTSGPDEMTANALKNPTSKLSQKHWMKCSGQ